MPSQAHVSASLCLRNLSASPLTPPPSPPTRRRKSERRPLTRASQEGSPTVDSLPPRAVSPAGIKGPREHLHGTVNGRVKGGREHRPEGGEPRRRDASPSLAVGSASGSAVGTGALPTQNSSSTFENEPSLPHPPGSAPGKEEIVVPWDDDTVQDPDMRKYGLVVYRPLHILLCVGCKSVINPDHIHTHVRREQRHVDITKAYCDSLKARFRLTPKSLLRRPSIPKRAIPCLQVKENYAYCSVCNRAFAHSRTLRSKHSTCPGHRVEHGLAQTFFPRSHHGGYFAVTMPPSEPRPRLTNLAQRLRNSFPDPDPVDVPITLPPNPRDSNHFLEMQQWVPTLDGLTGAEVQFIAREVNPLLRTSVRDTLGRYMDAVDESLRHSTHAMRVAMGSYNGFVSPFFPQTPPLLTK